MKQEGYSIKDLEVLSGVKMHTIRIWEKRYELLHPERTETNIRLYGDKELRRLLNVSLLTKNGFKISKVAAWSDNEIQNTVIKLSEGKSTDSDYIDRLMLLMVDFDTEGLEQLVDNILEESDFEKACFTVFFKLFDRIGAYWQAGSVFPAQEHYVSNIFRQKLIAAIDSIKIEDSRSPNILFYLPEGELHELGLMFYSYIAKKQGCNIIYLGQSVPFNDLEKVTRKKQVDYVFVSFINPIQKKALETYLQNLKQVFQKQKVFITGYQVQQHNPILPRNVKVVKNYKEFKWYLGY